MLKRWLLKILGGKVRLVGMTEVKEETIYRAMASIDGIDDFWEFQRQAGYQMFARTREEKYLGFVEMATTMQQVMKGLNKPVEKEEPEGRGYKATV